MIKLLVVFFIVNAIGACTKDDGGNSARLMKFDRYALHNGVEVQTTFPERYLLGVENLSIGNLSGSFECNYFQGKTELADGVLSIVEISMTTERCIYDVDSSEVERQIYEQAIFGGPLMYSRINDEVRLVNVDMTILIFTPQYSN